MSRRLRVGILFGGRSAEHEISILSARNVVSALDRSRFEPVLIGIGRDGKWSLQAEGALLEAASDPRTVALQGGAPSAGIQAWARGGMIDTGAAAGGVAVDVFFPVLHGPMGEDGTVQGLLELADVAYVGAGVVGSAIGMDKDVMKRLLRDADIPVAAFVAIRKSAFETDPRAACERAAHLGFPCFTKPANLGSSVGVSKVKDASELEAAIAFALQFDEKAIVEEAIVGREIECSVLGNDAPIASVPGEIIVRHAEGFYSYDAKYVDESGAELVIPAKLTDTECENVKRMAIAAFQALECSGLARVDFFLEPSGRLLVNEINTLPGFTRISMYPKLWEESGIGPEELVSRLIDLAVERHARKKARLTTALPGRTE